MDLIKYTIGYSKDNLGKGYNDFMSTLQPGQWGALVDIDFILWSEQFELIERIVSKHPHTGIFTCLTNRVGNLDQCFNHKIDNDPNIGNHRRTAMRLQRIKGEKVRQLKTVISGHFMIIKKETWDKIKFKDGILGVDNDYSQKILKAKMPIYLMEGVFGFHYYRLLEGLGYKAHLVK